MNSFPTLEARLVIVLTFVKVVTETQCFHLPQPSNKIMFYILYVYSIFIVSWYEDGISSRWAFGGSVRAPRAVLPSLSMLNTFAYTRQLLAIVTYCKSTYLGPLIYIKNEIINLVYENLFHTFPSLSLK